MHFYIKPSFFLITTFMLFLFPACQEEKETPSSFAHIKDEKVKTLLTKSMQRTGGLENWESINKLHFKKYFALYDSLGNTENSVNQIHQHTYYPDQDIYINWKKDSSTYQIHSLNENVKRTIDGKLDSNATKTSLINTIRSATFVMSIPFNLLDPGVVFEYKGFDTLEDGKEVEVLQADYDPQKHNNHSTKDIWWFYFDKDEHHLIGYMVQHADHYSYVKNLSFEKINGFIFPKVRKSWRVNKNREILYLRAEYEYSDFKIEM